MRPKKELPEMKVTIIGKWTEKHTAAMVAMGHRIADDLDERDRFLELKVAQKQEA